MVVLRPRNAIVRARVHPSRHVPLVFTVLTIQGLG
jgi:hypothetical protein